MSKKKDSQKRFREVVQEGMTLIERTDAEAADGPRRIRGIGAFADRVNQNRRIYSGDVLRDAVRRAEAKLARSLSQGNILGEADHPPYGTRVLDTVVKWERLTFNETTNAVEVEGVLIPTDAGRNVLTLMEAGVFPGLSLRGYGESQYDTEKEIETVTYLELTGFDLVFEPSFEEAGVTVLEHKQPQQERGEPKMNEDEKGGNAQVVDAQLAADLLEQTRQREAAEKARVEAERKVAEMEAKAKALTEEKEKAEQTLRERAVADAIAEATRALTYDANVVAKIREAAEAAGLKTPAEAQAFIARECARVDAIAEMVKARDEEARKAAEAAEAAGRVETRGVKPKGAVVETVAGRPEYLEFSEQVREQLLDRQMVTRDARRDESPAGKLAAKMLEAFDKNFKTQLIEEHNARRAWMEALATTDLNLPYSISRAVIAEAVPTLVAANVFDFGLIDGSPTRVWFGAYASETGAAPAVTNEAVTSDESAWVALAHTWIRPGTVVVKNSAESTTYTEHSDYRIDYDGGRIYTVASGSGGTIGDAASIKVSYTYDAIATGEGGAIQRGKTTMSYQDVAVAALRLAVLVNDEASALGMTQMGWDPVTSSVSSLIREFNEKIDQAMFYKALNAAVDSGNTGGTWSAATAEGDLAKCIGIAKAAVMNDGYRPTSVVMSVTNADRLSNWTGLTRQGFPDALLGSAGFQDMVVKGLNVFASTQMPDTHVLVTDRELVQHRVLASRPMSLKGPFQYRNTDAKLTAQQEWYIEQYSGQWVFVSNKGGYVRVTA